MDVMACLHEGLKRRFTHLKCSSFSSDCLNMNLMSGLMHAHERVGVCDAPLHTTPPAVRGPEEALEVRVQPTVEDGVADRGAHGNGVNNEKQNQLRLGTYFEAGQSHAVKVHSLCV